MMNIEGHWETVTSLEDVARVVREYYNRELADKIDELTEVVNSEIDDLKYQIDDLEMRIDELEYEIEDLNAYRDDEE